MLATSNDATSQTKPFVTLWIDHGTAPVNASAEYAIVPNISAAAMQQWAATRPLSILVNNERVSAVRDNRTSAVGIAFWTPGSSIEGIQCDAQAVVYISGREIWATDPNANATGTFMLTIPGRFTANVPSTTTLTSTTLRIPRASGQTTHVMLTPLPAKRRAAGH